MLSGEGYTPEHLRPVHAALKALAESYLGPGEDTGSNDFCWSLHDSNNRALWLWGYRGTSPRADRGRTWLELHHGGGEDWGVGSMEDFENQKADIAADLARVAILLAQ